VFWQYARWCRGLCPLAFLASSRKSSSSSAVRFVPLIGGSARQSIHDSLQHGYEHAAPLLLLLEMLLRAARQPSPRP
jgi:hypothetical protein